MAGGTGRAEHVVTFPGEKQNHRLPGSTSAQGASLQSTGRKFAPRGTVEFVVAAMPPIFSAVRTWPLASSVSCGRPTPHADPSSWTTGCAAGVATKYAMTRDPA